ncbi:MAG: alpha/beta fold hydrolase [Novosphingobium sp.]
MSEKRGDRPSFSERKPKLLGRAVGFYSAMFKVALGRSEVAADPKDARFRDRAWLNNPFYRRVLQAYLVTCEAVEAMIPEDLPIEKKARAELVAAIATSAIAPTNTLLGNPAALARTIESGGGNLVRGLKAFVTDVAKNGGMPRQVDDSSFEVGRNLAITPGKVVLRTKMFELIHYAPATESVKAIPVLLVPPQIGRYYFTDLAPGRSFAEYTVAQGLQYFAISWRNPSEEERDFGLDDYAAAAREALDAVLEITGQERANLVGFCAGGILSAIVAASLGASDEAKVNSLTLCVTMLDFDTDASLGAFRFPALLKLAKAKSDKKGVLPGSELHKIFTWMRPNDLVWNYWVNNYLMGEPPPAFDILAWNKDSTNLAARLHSDFLELFESNHLVRPGDFHLRGNPINLAAITCDTFAVGAITDHITPWKACYQSQTHLRGDTVFALSNGGHIAALVNPPGNAKAFHWIAPAAAETADAWHQEAEKRSGSWWESWTAWCAQRSGPRVPAARSLGSMKFAPLADAPGSYVRL